MPHPLDPLGADEIRDAVALLRADTRVPDDPRFADVYLDEPHKDVVAAFDAGARDDVDRRVRFRLVAGLGPYGTAPQLLTASIRYQ